MSEKARKRVSESMQDQSEVLDRRWALPFFSVWTGQALSLLGSRVAQFALVWWLTELGSATVLATASMVAFIPEVFLAPIAGAYVDRWDRRKVMIAADSFIALVSLWLATMFWTGRAQTWHIYVIMLARAIGGSFHWPAMQASTTLMVPKAQLTRVAGLNQTLYGLLGIFGPPLGALLMETLPLHGVMLVDVATALLAITPLFFVTIPQPRRKGSETGEISLWSDLRAGARYVWGWTGMVYLIVLVFVFKIAMSPAFSLLPLLVKEHFGQEAAEYGYMQAVLGTGSVLGGLFLSAWGGFRRKIVTSLLGVIVFSLGFLGLGFAPGALFWMAMVSAFVMGFALPLIDGPFMAILQSTVSPEMQGRVFTLTVSLLNISSPFSLAVAGPISDALGLQVWYIAAGFLCIGLAVAGFLIRPIINIEENAGEEEIQEHIECKRGRPPV